METLKEILAEYNLPARARSCYQCGACTGGCPVGRIRWDFNPRRFIEMLIRGEVEDLLLAENIWLCSHCLTCLERCPQQIEVSEIIMHVKNCAARLGNVPENVIKMADLIMNQGWIDKPVKRMLKKRQGLGLPEQPEGIDSEERKALCRCLDWSAKMKTFKTGKSGGADGRFPVSNNKKGVRERAS